MWKKASQRRRSSAEQRVSTCGVEGSREGLRHHGQHLLRLSIQAGRDCVCSLPRLSAVEGGRKRSSQQESCALQSAARWCGLSEPLVEYMDM